MEDDECTEELGRPISSMKVTELRDELTRRALIKTGNKKELVDRLRLAIQRESSKYSDQVADLSTNQTQLQQQQPQQEHVQINEATDLSMHQHSNEQLDATDLTIQQQRTSDHHNEQQDHQAPPVTEQQIHQDPSQYSSEQPTIDNSKNHDHQQTTENLSKLSTQNEAIPSETAESTQPSVNEETPIQITHDCAQKVSDPSPANETDAALTTNSSSEQQVTGEENPTIDRCTEKTNISAEVNDSDLANAQGEKSETSGQPQTTTQEEQLEDKTESSQETESPKSRTLPEPRAILIKKRGLSDLRSSGSGRKEKRRKWGTCTTTDASNSSSDQPSQLNLISGGISSQKLQELIGKDVEINVENPTATATSIEDNSHPDDEVKQATEVEAVSNLDQARQNLDTSEKKENETNDQEEADSQHDQHDLDELFNKTKCVPNLFWLPLTDDLADAREKVRAEREIKAQELAAKAKQAREAREARLKEISHKSKRSPARRRSPPRKSSVRYRSPHRRSSSRHRVSPPRRRSPPPMSRRRSPIRVSPIRRRSPVPMRRSPGPIRKSPPRRSPGPIRRSPIRRSPGPIRRSPIRRSPGPMRRSPGPIRRSPGPMRRSPGPIRRSPGPMRRSPGPMRRSPMASRRSPGPIRRSPGPIRRSPASFRRSPGPIRRSPGMNRVSPMLRRSPMLGRGASPPRGARSPPRRRSPSYRRSRSISPDRGSNNPYDQRRLQRSDRLR